MPESRTARGGEAVTTDAMDPTPPESIEKLPSPQDAIDADAAVAEADAEVTRWERAILDARTDEEAEAARDALTQAELRLEEALDRQYREDSGEGWPRGK